MADKHLSSQFDSELNAVSSRVHGNGRPGRVADPPRDLGARRVRRRRRSQVIAAEVARQHDGSRDRPRAAVTSSRAASPPRATCAS